MTQKKDIRNLGVEELRSIKSDFSRLRGTCEDYGITVLKFYQTLEELEETNSASAVSSCRVRRKLSRKTRRIQNRTRLKRVIPKNAEELVVQTFRDFRERAGRNNTADYSAFISEVEVDLRKGNLETDKRCPLTGFVSQVLYEFAESQEFGEDKTSSARHSGMVNRPINSGDLERILKIKFDESSFKQIAGNLEPDYLRKHYVLDSVTCSIKLKGENGEIIDDPNIEGTICFDGGSKRYIREQLAEFFSSHLFPNTEKIIAGLNYSIKQRTEEKSSRLNRLGEIEREMQTLEQKDNSTVYRFEAEKEQDLRTLKKTILSKLTGKKEITGREKINGIDFKIENERDSNAGSCMTLEINGENSSALINKLLESIIGFSRESIRGNVNYVNAAIGRRSRRKEQLQEEKESIVGELNGIESKLQEIEKARTKASRVNFLGLEGPGFGSYLALYNAVRKKGDGFSIAGNFVEYNVRAFNLMKSIVEHIKDTSDTDPKVFSNSTLSRRNIDDLVLLDFPLNQEIRISASDQNAVEYKEEKLSLADYHTLLNFLDIRENQTKPYKLSEMFGISEEFVSATRKRVEGTFDIVFLDYFGDYRDRKTEVLKHLASKRMSDDAVIAVTFIV